MSAQKELAKLLAGGGEDKHWQLCADFIADHGPAIAELIEAAVEVIDYGWSQRLNRLEAALHKLTEPKA